MNAGPAVAEGQSSLAPIVVDLLVACPTDRAFDYFTRDIGLWWPLRSHVVPGVVPAYPSGVVPAKVGTQRRCPEAR